MAEGELTPKQQRFIDEYMIDLNGTQAAIRAGYSQHTANEQASGLLAKVSIRTEVDRRIAARAAEKKLTADLVVDQLHGMITADANELVELRRVCCHHCYGIDYQYQYTASEREKRLQEFSLLGERDADGNLSETFDERGGVGYDRRKDPNPDCPECFGEGVEVVFAKDTRKLSPAARALYAGVKTTEKGLEIKMHSKEAAIKLAAQHLGMISDSKSVNVNVSLEVLVAASMKTEPADDAKTIEHEKNKP